jgi:flagellar assembly protein FliH
MSSKLHRGGVSSEPVAFRRVPSVDSVPLNGQVFLVVNSCSSLEPEAGGQGSNSAVDAQSAYQRGFTEGKAAGRQEMTPQIEAMNHKLARTIEELTGLRQRFRHEAEEDVVALALATARRILHRELTVEPEALLGLIKAALEKIELREVHRVRVSREDAPMVGQCLEKMGLPHRVEVIADPSLERGSAILDSSRGTLDASIETQLAEIERGFADLMRRT